MKKLFNLLGMTLSLAGPALLGSDSSSAGSTLQATATVTADQPGPLIRREIYGHFTEHLGRCVYEGIWVGLDSPIPNTRGIRNDVLAALRTLKVPVVRWPGGCFADEYHWRDGIGPSEKRPSMINTHWGGTVENNHFGTHEFLDFVEQLGCDAYISGNVGSGTVQEMMEWVEYMTSDADSPLANLRRTNGRQEPWKIKYFGVGNESWGCGGSMRPEFYADLYRRYNTFVKNYSGQKIERIGCGASASDYNWTDKVMEGIGDRMDGLSLHYYTLPTGSWSGSKGSATEFSETEWHTTLKRTLFMEELITKQSEVMDKHDPEKKIGMVVDEWGSWYDVEKDTNPGWLYQQNTLRDAIIAGLNLNIFHKHADRVTMANLAQMINVLQSVILTDKEKMILTPTYHVLRMYNVHQDAKLLPFELSTPDYVLNGEAIPAVHASASVDKNGKIHISLVNTEVSKDVKLTITLTGSKAKAITGEILNAPAITSKNTFEEPAVVAPRAFSGASLAGKTVVVELPAHSVVVLELAD